MKIAIFGGAFDPPHNGHQQIVLELLRQQLADQVWLVPVKNHPFAKIVTPDQHRLAMLKVLAPDERRIKINQFELEQEGISYTYKTLRAFSQVHPNQQFSFVIGSDNLIGFKKWDQSDKLIDSFPFWVYPRQGYPLELLQSNMTVMEGVREVDVASTDVRQAIRAGELIEKLVPVPIAAYILKHQLYLELDANNS